MPQPSNPRISRCSCYQTTRFLHLHTVGQSDFDHVCNVQKPISAVHSFRFAPFTSIDCTLTTTWCLRLVRICLSFLNLHFHLVTSNTHCSGMEMQTGREREACAVRPIPSLFSNHGRCTREASQLALIPFVISSGTSRPMSSCSSSCPRLSRVVVSSLHFSFPQLPTYRS